jgi:hypothetical protein
MYTQRGIHYEKHGDNISLNMSAYRLAIMGEAFAKEISRKYNAFEKEFNTATFVEPLIINLAAKIKICPINCDPTVAILSSLNNPKYALYSNLY